MKIDPFVAWNADERRLELRWALEGPGGWWWCFRALSIRERFAWWLVKKVPKP